MAKKWAIVLPGGGAAGAEQFGMLKAIWASGLRPDFLVGSSVGALNAAAISCSGSFPLETMWRSIRSLDDIFQGEFWVQFPFVSGIKNPGPLADKLRSLTEKPATVPYFVTATAMKSQSTVVTPHTDPDIFNMTVASARIPGLVESYQKSGETYCDGGVMANLPVEQAAALGAEVVVCLHCRAESATAGDAWQPGNPVTQFVRGFELCDGRVYLDALDWAAEHGVLVKSVWSVDNSVGPLDFDAGKIAVAIDRGFATGQLAVAEIRAAVQ